MSRLRCYVVTWEQGKKFPVEELERAVSTVFNNHSPSFVEVETGREGVCALVVAPRPIASPVAGRAWVEFLEHGETNPVDLQLLTRA